MEQQHYRMVSYQLSDAPGRVTRSAPCVGEHNDVVFREWLELSDDEYRELAALGVFS
jgi:crotonobetainyl-CoA:carnitine CoA-transferase CaiB-like acyl-CoA transferase